MGSQNSPAPADRAGKLLGGRFVSAMSGSAPISAEMKAWVERLLDMHLLEGYGSTEAGSVFVDGQIQRPPVIDYKLVDVPDLGYFRTDQPHPRGELLVKSEQMFPGAEPDGAAGETVLRQLLTVSRHPAHFIAVCDDIWHGGEDYEGWTETYVRELARICRGLAAEFDVVCEMTAGIARVWKGELPRV